MERFKSVFCTLAFAMILAIVLVSPAGAIDEAPIDSYFDYEPQINNRGMATWVREDLKVGQNAIFMFNGLNEIQLSGWGGNSSPQINDNGWVVWEQNVQGDTETFDSSEPFDTEIYLYNGLETRRLTKNDGYDIQPQLNNNGWVAWEWHDDGTQTKIFLSTGEKTIELASNTSVSGCTDPKINDDGWVVWGCDREIFLYNGEETIQLSHNNGIDSQARINNEGWVVWSGGDSKRDIWLHDGTSTTQLTNNELTQYGYPEDVGPEINASGQVTWTRNLGWRYNIFLFNGQETTELGSGSGSQINDRGWVVWTGYDGNDHEVFLYDGIETIQLTDNDFNDRKPQINNMNWNPQDYVGAGALALSDRKSARSLAWAANTGKTDDTKPRAYVSAPFVSTRISKTTTVKIKWGATDPAAMVWQAKKGRRNPLAFAGDSGIKSYTVRYRPSTSRKWRTWKKDVKTTQAYFTGKAGVTYYFRVRAQDNAGNFGWSKVRKTIIPFNEGMSLIRQVGFNGYLKNSKSPFFLSSVRYSYTRRNTLVYKLYNNNGIGLVTTKGPSRGRAKIYVDGKYVKTIDAYKSSLRPRQLVFYRGFSKKGTHWLKIENLGTPGRARFDVDGVVVAR